jgi:hypothetical protein
MAVAPKHFRAVGRDEDGEEFVDFLYRRAQAVTDTSRQARALRDRLWIFVQQYDHLRDDLQPERVTVERYAERWDEPERSAFRAFAEFASVFPGDNAPEDVCEELWNGIGRQAGRGEFMQLGAVKVAEEA